jgi:hypothetical protein
MDKILVAFDQPKENQEVTDLLNRTIISNEIKAVIKNLSTKKSPGSDGFSAEFYQTFKELIPMLFKFSMK